MLLQIWAVGFPVGQNLPFDKAYAVFKAALFLPCLIQRVLPPVVGNALGIVVFKLLQLGVGVLRLTHAQNNRAGRVPAVQVADAALQAVVQGLVLSITVLPSLYRFVVWRTGCMGADFPAITPQGIVVSLLDFIVQLPQLVHKVSAAGIFNAHAAAALLLDRPQAALGQRGHSTADSRIKIQAARGNLAESKIHGLFVCRLQRQHLALRRVCPQIAQHFSCFSLTHTLVALGHLPQAAVLIQGQAFICHILKQAVDDFLVDVQLLGYCLFNSRFAFAQRLGAVDLVLCRIGDGPGFLDAPAHIPYQLINAGLCHGKGSIAQTGTLFSGQGCSPQLSSSLSSGM